MSKKKDNINPEHYKRGGIEAYDYLMAKMSKEELIGFCKGNAIKYMSRAKYKDVKKETEDYQKAQWFVNKLVEASQLKK